jgi:hypothetical protein
MQANVGNTDRKARILIGLTLLALFFVLDGNVRWFGLFGVLIIDTGLRSFCPLYSLIRIKTCAPARKA